MTYETKKFELPRGPNGEHRCSAMVHTDGWPRGCRRFSKVRRNGKDYCRAHDPVARAERRGQSDAKWQQQQIERENAIVARRREHAKESARAFLSDYFKQHPDHRDMQQLFEAVESWSA
jgi:hypothetical protein